MWMRRICFRVSAKKKRVTAGMRIKMKMKRGGKG